MTPPRQQQTGNVATPPNPSAVGAAGVEGVNNIMASPVLASQRPDFRTLSLDSQQFLQHALTVDGEALQQYIEHETGTSFNRLSVSPKKGVMREGGGVGRVSADAGAAQQQRQQQQNHTQLADMMLSLVHEPNFDVGVLQGVRLEHGGELLNADTLDRVLGGELRKIAGEVRMDGMVGEAPLEEAMPPPAPRVPNPQPRPQSQAQEQQEQQQQCIADPVTNVQTAVESNSKQNSQQYVTFMDGHMLQREDATPAIVTFPEGSMAGAIQVPVPGSDRHLQYVPLLNSRVLTAEDVQVQAQTAAQEEMCSPSQTARMVADAAKQHAELMSGVEEGRKSAEGQKGAEVIKTKKPQLRQVDSGEFGEGDLGHDSLERKVSHKRERSVTLRELPNLELDSLPSAKLLSSGGIGTISATQSSVQFPQYSVTQMSEFFASTDIGRGIGGGARGGVPVPGGIPYPQHSSRTVSNTSNASTPTEMSAEDVRKQLTAYIRPLKLFSDGLDDLLDDEIRSILSNTLETPPGVKRRGRPPGRSKNIADILPEGWVEPTDAEILANLLLERPSLKTQGADELKKQIRKEKNKISAAMSRVRLTNETKDLEGEIRKLEEEHSTLSEWLTMGSGSVARRQSGEADGAGGGQDGHVVKNTLIRHFSL